jgi:hypothetical protein
MVSKAGVSRPLFDSCELGIKSKAQGKGGKNEKTRINPAFSALSDFSSCSWLSIAGTGGQRATAALLRTTKRK